MVTKGYGIFTEYINDSCPADLQPYADAYILARKERDIEAWMQWGSYGLSALTVAIERNLAGSKAKNKYIEHPALYDKTENSEYSESKEECAVYEMKQRINLLRQQGLPESPD